MCSRGWTLLWVVSMAAPALASGPVDTAPRAPVSGEVAYLIIRTRWVGMYRRLGPAFRAELANGVLRAVGGNTFEVRLRPGAGASGSCELINGKRTYLGIYRLERDRLLISSALSPSDPRPRTFAITSRSDLVILKPVPGK